MPARHSGHRAGIFLLRLALFVTAITLWSAATLVWWAEDQVPDESRFTTAVAEALRLRESREVIAARAWEELLDEFPLLQVVRASTAEATIADLLERPGWTPIFRDSAREVYLSALADRVRPVHFNLAEDYPLLLQALLPFDPSLFGELRPLPALGTVPLLSSDEIPHLGRWLPVPGWLAPLLFLTGFSALIGLVATRPSPALALVLMGATGGLAGVLILVLLPTITDGVHSQAGGRLAQIVTTALLRPWQESLSAAGTWLALTGGAAAALGLLAALAGQAAHSLRVKNSSRA